MYNPMQVMQMLTQKYNVPQGLNNPQELVQHLMNSGQISQEQYNQARAFAQQMGFKF